MVREGLDLAILRARPGRAGGWRSAAVQRDRVSRCAVHRCCRSGGRWTCCATTCCRRFTGAAGNSLVHLARSARHAGTGEADHRPVRYLQCRDRRGGRGGWHRAGAQTADRLRTRQRAADAAVRRSGVAGVVGFRHPRPTRRGARRARGSPADLSARAIAVRRLTSKLAAADLWPQRREGNMPNLKAAGIGAVLLAMAASAQAAGTLRVGMQDDPDALDPARGGTFAGRIVFVSLCDKLVDLGPDLKFAPQLATDWSWSRGRQGADADPARGREVPGRRTVQRRCGAREHRPLPHRPGEQPQGRAAAGHRGRGDRSEDGAPGAVAALCAADRGAVGSRGDDGFAQGDRTSGQGLRHRSGVRRPVQLRRARAAGPHGAGTVSRLLECGRDPSRSHRVPADRRFHGAAGEPADRPARYAGGAGAVRCREGGEGSEAEAAWRDVARV